MNINLHHLELFYYVAEAQGISQAVKVIPYSIQQPAISQQVKSLETSLGVKLFERRPFELTEAGRVLLDTMAPFMEKLATIEDELKGMHRTRLRIGCAALISDHYIPEILPGLIEEFPNILTQVFELEGNDPYRRLLTRDLDLVISSEAPPRSRAVISELILTLPYCIIVPKEHEFAKKITWTETALMNTKWVALQENTGGMQKLSEELKKISLSPSYSAGTNSIATALKYISMNLGVGFAIKPPNFLLEQYGLVAIPQKRIAPADLHISYTDNPRTRDVIQSFMKRALSLLKAHQKDF
ncbi:MAG: LysR family transcriptional regulator [Lentisphaeraceae bacterium]|nr:LysR family transcriptional regulator [Lentisphaeraceae bacterium]